MVSTFWETPFPQIFMIRPLISPSTVLYLLQCPPSCAGGADGGKIVILKRGVPEHSWTYIQRFNSALVFFFCRDRPH